MGSRTFDAVVKKFYVLCTLISLRRACRITKQLRVVFNIRRLKVRKRRDFTWVYDAGHRETRAEFDKCGLHLRKRAKFNLRWLAIAVKHGTKQLPKSSELKMGFSRKKFSSLERLGSPSLEKSLAAHTFGSALLCHSREGSCTFESRGPIRNVLVSWSVTWTAAVKESAKREIDGLTVRRIRNEQFFHGVDKSSNCVFEGRDCARAVVATNLMF